MREVKDHGMARIRGSFTCHSTVQHGDLVDDIDFLVWAVSLFNLTIITILVCLAQRVSHRPSTCEDQPPVDGELEA